MSDTIEVTKKDKKKKVLEVKSEESQTKVEKTDDTPKVEPVKEPEEVTPSSVRVFISKSVKCVIGKTEYIFDKDKKDGYMVSPDVRQVLRESGILKITY